eukprot:gnl/Hemi2/21808_TR7282_c0_g1_i1.p1 gnl/Hemi2/21808_TR7282_c0_g1~~gnl/Hemi2/21808_TR7282_c0_g1_i1.p1  ORF type:complete len:441 (+),score=-3.20 gnl/Hemi2/21808_TR7282_c0_g1_i1:247-1569(+)
MAVVGEKRPFIASSDEVCVKKPRGEKQKHRCCNTPGCTSLARPGYDRCCKCGGGPRCEMPGCTNGAISPSTHCKRHGGLRCITPGCTSSAGDRKTRLCVKCGGGPRCAAKDCTKGAVHGYLFCRKHDGGKKCQTEGCTTAAVSSYQHCKRHGGGRQCQSEGCTTSARSGYQYCVKHNGAPRCQTEGCTTAARDGYQHCKRHGANRCAFEGCNTSAADASTFCKHHNGGKRCQAENCPTAARTGYLFCTIHGGHRCATQGCTKGAQGATKYCVACGGGRRCDGCGLFSVRKAGGLCYYCDTSRQRKTKETEVLHYLEANVTIPITSHDKTVSGNICMRYRPDVLYDQPGFAVIVEVDEDQHSSYDKRCEMARMEALVHDLGKPAIFVRYNPDRYTIDGQRQRTMTKVRLATLAERVTGLLRRYETVPPERELQVIYMYYDE